MTNYTPERCAKEFDITLDDFYAMESSFKPQYSIKDNKALYCDGDGGYVVIECHSDIFDDEEDGISMHSVDFCAYFEIPLSTLIGIVDDLIGLKELDKDDE